jgi:hypothetical protein
VAADANVVHLEEDNIFSPQTCIVVRSSVADIEREKQDSPELASLTAGCIRFAGSRHHKLEGSNDQKECESKTRNYSHIERGLLLNNGSVDRKKPV